MSRRPDPNIILQILQNELEPDSFNFKLDVANATLIGNWRLRKFFTRVNKEHKHVIGEMRKLVYDYKTYSLVGFRLFQEISFQPKAKSVREILEKLPKRAGRPNTQNRGHVLLNQDNAIYAAMWNTARQDPLLTSYSVDSVGFIIKDYRSKAKRNLNRLVDRFVKYSRATAFYLDALKSSSDKILEAKRIRNSPICLRLQLIGYALKIPTDVHLLSVVFQQVLLFKCPGSKCHHLDELLGNMCYLIQACSVVLKLILCSTDMSETDILAEADSIVAQMNRVAYV